MEPTLPPTAAPQRPDFAGTLMERMGITVSDVSGESCRGSMPVVGNTQPVGLLHGGASAVLVETLGSLSATAHAGPDRAVVGIELNVTHHHSARTGFVHGVATALHLGRKLACYEVSVHDDEGNLTCTGRLTCMILEKTG
jgi:uncharacterized protein (TIGR00369 family)